MKNEAYEILFIMDPSVLRMSHFSMRNNGSKLVLVFLYFLDQAEPGEASLRFYYRSALFYLQVVGSNPNSDTFFFLRLHFLKWYYSLIF
jgi:hypothetical protein